MAIAAACGLFAACGGDEVDEEPRPASEARSERAVAVPDSARDETSGEGSGGPGLTETDTVPADTVAAGDTLAADPGRQRCADPGPEDDEVDGSSRDWFVLTFRGPVEEPDVQWLRENGFCVDRVLGDASVRGWLPGGVDGAFLSDTARLADVDALMR